MNKYTVAIHRHRNRLSMSSEDVAFAYNLHRYNSAFYSSIATNDYNVIYATAGFLKREPYNNTHAIGGAWQPPGYDPAGVQSSVNSWERLANADCIRTYAQDFITSRRTLVIIADNTSEAGGSLLGSDNFEYQPPGGGYDPYSWSVWPMTPWTCTL